MTKDNRFSLKAQFSYGTEYGFHLFFRDVFGVSAILGYESFLPSSLNLGFSYKGYSALNSGLRISGRTPVLIKGIDRDVLFAGASGGIEGSFAKYTDLPHYFFYLSLTLEPFLDILPLPAGRWFIRGGIPLVFRFRKDTDFSMDMGISIHLFHEPAIGHIVSGGGKG